MKDTAMTDWQRIWNDDEYRRLSPVRAILFLFAQIYRLVAGFRNRLYDRRLLKTVRLSCPVISIGNISVGGTGKTPCVVLVAKLLKSHGYSPAILSRGYGGKSSASVNVVSDENGVLLDVETAGDEPVLLARSLPGIPVLTGARRVLTGQAAINRFGANVLICDDAFQHRQIVRDLDIVLLDGEKPLGNGHLLPRGELREPPEGLGRASCILLTRAEAAGPLDPDIARMAGRMGIPVFRSVHSFEDMKSGDERTLMSPENLRGRKICAFCGIARPASFEKLLLEAGTEICAFLPFPDHYAYNRFDLEAIKGRFQKENADYWVTTEKDAMRLAGHAEFLKRIWIMRMKMKMQPSSDLLEHFILERLPAPVRNG